MGGSKVLLWIAMMWRRVATVLSVHPGISLVGENTFPRGNVVLMVRFLHLRSILGGVVSRHGDRHGAIQSILLRIRRLGRGRRPAR